MNKMRIAILAAAFSIFLTACNSSSAHNLVVRTDNGPVYLNVELARTPEEKVQGLMGREALADNSGMIFLYEQPRQMSFWMKDVPIALDIMFVGSDKRIKYIAANLPPCLEADSIKCPTYHSQDQVQYVLELKGGQAEALGIGLEDKLEFNFD
jgi:hypothetical protein